MNEDYAKELASELDPILSARDVAGGFPWMEYMRWVQLSSILVLYANVTLILCIVQHV
jgi:hypothetical protein